MIIEFFIWQQVSNNDKNNRESSNSEYFIVRTNLNHKFMTILQILFLLYYQRRTFNRIQKMFLVKIINLKIFYVKI